jgi:hypothetical protein
LLLVLASLAIYVYQLRHTPADESVEAPNAVAGEEVALDRLDAHLEKTDDQEQLRVTLRLRGLGTDPIECYLFLVARSENSASIQWAIWPPGSPGLAISAGGHFHAAHPASGHSLLLGDSWEHIDALLPLAADQPAYDSVVVYLVRPNGNILLERPFAL